MSEQTSVTTCNFPGCENPPEPATARPGRPPEYCADPAHTRVSAWRERRRLEAEAAGTTTNDAEVAQPLTMARLAGADLLRGLATEGVKLAGIAEQIQRIVTDVTDPTSAEVELEAARGELRARTEQAEAAATRAEQQATTADSMRKAADEAAEEMAAHLADEAAGPRGPRAPSRGDRGACR